MSLRKWLKVHRVSLELCRNRLGINSTAAERMPDFSYILQMELAFCRLHGEAWHVYMYFSADQVQKWRRRSQQALRNEASEKVPYGQE